MGFFDFKLILIIFLLIIIFALYNDLLSIKKKVNLLINKNNKQIQPIKENIEFENFNDIFDIFNNNNKIYCDIDEKCKFYMDKYNDLNQEYFDDLNEDYLYQDNSNKECLYEDDIDKVIKEYVEENDIVEEDVVEKEVVEIHNDIDDNKEEYINDDNSKHLETFSNDVNDIVSVSSNKEEIKETKIDINNLGKYKLPELQDIALQLKISLNNDKKNKNKTKNELIIDIKNTLNK
jgi:hypothetical protein